MGGLSSKLDEIVGDSKGPHTPKTKQIPFDPRSPSDNISRTPITMVSTREDNGINTTPTDAKVVKVVDPRSPNTEVNRTPIIFEKKESRRPMPLRPATNMNLDSFLCRPDDENTEEAEQDPRSPTIKVPRTPLEDKVLDLELKEAQGDQIATDDQHTVSAAVTEEKEKNEENKLVKKLFITEGPVDKVRRPLVVVQNKNVEKTPKDLLQAKHCKNVEDEYNKNLNSLLPDQENTVNSNTQFVENI